MERKLKYFLLGCYFKTNFGVYNVVYAIDNNKFGKLSLEYKTRFVNILNEPHKIVRVSLI
jgi:hypothetical protein